MSISKVPLQENWEFDVLQVYNYRRSGPLQHFFRYLIENHAAIDGDIVEAGVFQGRSCLATAHLLQELGSSKRVYAYDTFSGFPPVYHRYDDIATFEELRRQGRITQGHLDRVHRNIEYRERFLQRKVSPSNISTSGDFSGTSLEALQEKARLLGLENIVFVPGPFEETMVSPRLAPEKIIAALLDCDLYASYEVSLPFVWERLSLGGYLYLDEYYSLKFPGARIACDAFFADKACKPQMHQLTPGDFERWYVRKLVP